MVYINGKEIEFVAGESVYDHARRGELVDRSVISAKINGVVCGLTTPVNDGDTAELLTFDSSDGKHVFWHTASHILAQAVKRLYPTTKLTIGPAIDNGFYYDFDSDVAFSPDVLKKLEDEMKKIVKENLKIERC